jgi:hypothetical protein
MLGVHSHVFRRRGIRVDAWGPLIDWLHQGRTKLYKAPGPGSVNLMVAPVVTPGRKALMLRVSF